MYEGGVIRPGNEQFNIIDILGFGHEQEAAIKFVVPAGAKRDHLPKDAPATAHDQLEAMIISKKCTDVPFWR